MAQFHQDVSKATSAPHKLRSVCFLTRFEMSNLLSIREQHLSSGALTQLTKEELAGAVTPAEVAKRELILKRTPLLLRRKLPDGTHELVRPFDLQIPESFLR
jgi:hypothetical protein